MRILIAFLFFPLSLSAQIWGKVVSVHDGDTFTLLADDGRTLKVRLSYVDCPELRQPYGVEAKRRVAKLILKKRIKIDSTTSDKYHRMVAVAYTPKGEVLNDVILAEGLGWHYKKYDKSTHAANLEASARDLKIGLWACAEEPWVYRHKPQ